MKQHNQLKINVIFFSFLFSSWKKENEPGIDRLDSCLKEF